MNNNIKHPLIQKGSDKHKELYKEACDFIIRSPNLKSSFDSLYTAKTKKPADGGKEYAEWFAKWVVEALDNSCLDTSIEYPDDGSDPVTFGDYDLKRAEAAIRINLLGFPVFETSLEHLFKDDKSIWSGCYFYVEEGRVNGTVKIAGPRGEIDKRNKDVRDLFRSFGFGNAETLDGALALENGNLEYTTMADRSIVDFVED